MADGAGGMEVGRISIKVVPDLEEFRRKLKNGLEAIEKSVKCKIEIVPKSFDEFREKVKAGTQGIEAEVDVEANTAGVREEIEAAAKDTTAHVDVDVRSGVLDRFQRRLLGELSSILTRFEPKIKLDVDGEYLRREMNKEFSDIGKTIRAKIPLEPELAAAARAEAAEEVEAFKKYLELKLNPLKLRVEPELKTFEALAKQRIAETIANEDSVRRAQLQTEKIRDGIHERHARRRHRLDIDLLRRQAKEAADNFEDQKAKMGVELDKLDFRKTVEEYRALVSQVRADAEMGIKDKGLEAKVLATGARLRALAAAQDIKFKLDIDSDLARKTINSRFKKLMRSLKPSFGTGINLGGYAVILGLIATVAAPLLGLLTSALLALPGLISAVAAPVAAIALGLKGFGEAAESLKKPFEDLKTTMSNAARDAFTPVFDKLAGVFPSIEATLPRVTQGLADMAQAVVDTVTSADGLKKIESIISNIGDALSMSAPGMADFTDGFLTLAKSFTEKLPDLSGWFNDTGKAFKNWVNQITKDGSFSEAMDGLGKTLKLLLDTVGGWLKQGFEFVKDPEKMEKFLSGLRSVAKLLSAIVTLSDRLYASIQKVMNIFSSSPIGRLAAIDWSAVWGGMTIAFNSVVNGMKLTLSTFVSGIGTIITTGLSNARSWFNGIVEGFILAGLDLVVEAQTWPQKIKDAVGDLSGILVEAGAQAIAGLIAGAKARWEAAKGFFLTIKDWIVDHKGPISADRVALIPHGRAFMAGLQEGLEGGFEGVKARATAMAEQIAEAISRGMVPANIKEKLKHQLDQIDLMRQQLKVQADQATDKATKSALNDKRKQLQLIRDQLKLQQQQLGYSEKYGDQIGVNNEQLAGTLNKMVDIGKGFAEANIKQFASDIGISGNGAVSTLAETGIGWANSMLSQLISGGAGGTTIQVNSVDEALAAKKNIDNRRALQYNRR